MDMSGILSASPGAWQETRYDFQLNGPWTKIASAVTDLGSGILSLVMFAKKTSHICDLSAPEWRSYAEEVDLKAVGEVTKGYIY